MVRLFQRIQLSRTCFYLQQACKDEILFLVLHLVKLLVFCLRDVIPQYSLFKWIFQKFYCCFCGSHADFRLSLQDIDSAPLWDAQEQDFIGMITQTDLVSLLLQFERRIRAYGEDEDAPTKKMDAKAIESFQRELIYHLDGTTVRASRSMRL